MSLLVWDAKYMLGIAEIDRQHQQLFTLFNELDDAIRDGCGDGVATKGLGKVLDSTRENFAYEERLLQRHGYPEEAVHRAEHGRLADKTKSLLGNVAAGETEVSIATLKFLCDWLNEHILDSDREFAPFLIARGVH